MQDVFFVSNTRPKTEDCADFEQHPKFEHSLANGIPARQFNKRALQNFFFTRQTQKRVWTVFQ